MAQPTQAQIAHLTEFLKNNRSEPTLDDIMELAERMAASLEDTMARTDALVHEEFKTISAAIGSLKREMSSLRPDHLRFDRIPEAGRELDAVVEATEEASSAIMNAAEEIMAADASDPDAYKAMVDDRMIVIFEACAFQDLTGQRIRKVVKTLSWIEDRMTSLSQKLKLAGDNTDTLSEAEKRMQDLMLNGPQMKGAGISQDSVDDFFAQSDQDDIDALFK